ncbi:protein of unknown function [Taphrina deformans PYCC 5710]|uniref:Uncharacterized protein n=1 Tax=Taphrina deformans (strain PYCC 5710 / ATCC 11124 / CBS 356.35 / IMI 108563 / JCM 9778 / NBRC 8474) TaxID=1097556 RepID=R4X9M6_TAPDE|nr:protein of unknown function [Taphrina deformans PYCC 5710]|eukprot:CCG82466.1 protein of unknown function [Taphrina deformans PYCC 5710]
MSSEDALNAVNLNTIDSTPLRLQKFKRKQIEDDCTPKSRHIDKRLPQGSIDPKEATKPSSPVKEHVACDRSPVEDGTPRTATAAQTQGRQDVFAIQEERFDGATSVGSILSQPDFSVSVSRAAENDSEEDLHSDGEHTPRHEGRTSVDGSDGENVVTSARASVRSMSQNSVGDPSDEDTPVRARPQQSAVPSTTSPTRTPRLRDFLMPLNTPRSIVDSALRGRQSTATKEPSRGYPMFTEADLISFQTPAPKNHLDPQSRLRHFKTESGEDMLLDMTPRVYSPKSIPKVRVQKSSSTALSATIEHMNKEL